MLVTRMLYLNKYVETNIINNTSYKFNQIKRSPKISTRKCNKIFSRISLVKVKKFYKNSSYKFKQIKRSPKSFSSPIYSQLYSFDLYSFDLYSFKLYSFELKHSCSFQNLHAMKQVCSLYYLYVAVLTN